MLRLACRTALLTTTFCLLAVSSAFASTYYASPGGTAAADTGCLESAPCSISTAVELPVLVDGDDVVLLPGNYPTLSAMLTIDDGVTVHGTGRPEDTTITSTTSTPAIYIQDEDAVLSRVKLVHTNTSGSGVALIFGKIRNSIIDSQAPVACNVLDGWIIDTICIAHGSGSSSGFRGGGVGSSFSGTNAVIRLQNVTAIGKGASFSDGLFFRNDGGGSSAVVVANASIFSGTGYDVFGVNVGGTGTAVLSFSNYSSAGGLPGSGDPSITPVGTNNNQTVEPTFVDPGNDNYHLSPASLGAINLGGALNVDSGAFDVDGEDRLQGPFVDIGADELDTTPPAAPVITAPPSGSIVPKTFLITGTAEPGSIVNVGNGFIALCDATTNAEGIFSCSSAPLEDGGHSLKANAVDGAGNISAISGDVPVVVDSETPGVLITSPALGSKVATITVAFKLSELHPGVSECRIDTAGFAPCTSGKALGVKLADGKHTIVVRHTDTAGNVGSASTTFDLDATGPIVKKKSVKTKKRKTTIKFSANEAAKYTCKLDKAKAKSCKSTYKTKTLKKGKHKLAVFGSDSLGNVGKTLTIKWTVK